MRTILALTALTLASFAHAAEKPYFVYFGTYTKGMSKGVEVARFDASTGKLSKPETAVETPNPSFVAIHPNHKYLYAAGEQAQGIVSAFVKARGTDGSSPRSRAFLKLSSRG